MRDLVRDQIGCRLIAYAVLAIKDHAGVLGAAAESGRLYVRELLVWVWANLLAEELDRLAHRHLERDDAVRAIFREYPGLQRSAARVAKVLSRELGDANRNQPRCDRRSVVPMR